MFTLVTHIYKSLELSTQSNLSHAKLELGTKNLFREKKAVEYKWHAKMHLGVS